MILSIILAIIVALAIATATHLLHGGGLTEEVETRTGKKRSKFAFLKEVGSDEWIKALCVGLIVGALHYFTPKLSAALWLAPVFLAVMVAWYIYLMYWWHRDGSEWIEVIPFVVLAVVSFFTMRATAMATAALWNSAFWTSVVATIPWLFIMATIGFIIIDAFYFRYREMYEAEDGDSDEVLDEKDEKKGRYHALGILAIVVTTIILIVILATGVKWSSFNLPARNVTQPVVVETPTVTPNEPVITERAAQPFIAFFNPSMLKDEDSSNDFNFGYNPREFFPEWTEAKDFDRDFRDRIEVDPALLAADAAWLDAVVGTRYTGKFYDSCKGDWAETMNQAKVRFMEDPELYKATREAFFAFLDSATRSS